MLCYLEDRHPYRHKAPLVQGVQSSNPPVWRRNVNTHQIPRDESSNAGVSGGSCEFPSRLKCGHLPVYGSDPGLRDGTTGEHQAIRPRRALRCRAGSRESFEGYDRGSSEKLEEARGTSSPDLAESDHIRPATSEPWSERGLEKGTEQRPLAAGRIKGANNENAAPLPQVYFFKFPNFPLRF